MKQFFIAITITIAALGARAQVFEAGGISYQVTGPATVEVVDRPLDGGNDYHDVVIVPSSVFFDGLNYTVDAIAPQAFSHSHVTELVLPRSVTALGEGACEGATELASVTLPLGLKEVPDDCFAGTALESVALPDGVTAVGRNAFASCDRLHTVFMPASLRYIDDGAFDYCHSLSEVYCAAATPPLAVEGSTFDGRQRIDLIVDGGKVADDYDNDPVWGDRRLFTLYTASYPLDDMTLTAATFRQDWQQVELDSYLAFKVYDKWDELVAVTAASHLYLPAERGDATFTIVPTTFVSDASPIEVTVPATTGLEPAPAIEQSLGQSTPRVWAYGGVIHISGDHYGQWVDVFDLNGVLRYHRQSFNDDVPGLPRGRVYIVAVGRHATKVAL